MNVCLPSILSVLQTTKRFSFRIYAQCFNSQQYDIMQLQSIALAVHADSIHQHIAHLSVY